MVYFIIKQMEEAVIKVTELYEFSDGDLLEYSSVLKKLEVIIPTTSNLIEVIRSALGDKVRRSKNRKKIIQALS